MSMFTFAFTLIIMVGYCFAYRAGIHTGRNDILRQWEDWERKQNGEDDGGAE